MTYDVLRIMLRPVKVMVAVIRYTLYAIRQPEVA